MKNRSQNTSNTAYNIKPPSDYVYKVAQET